ncbi:Glutaredoxin 3, partial [Mortierella alpina]
MPLLEILTAQNIRFSSFNILAFSDWPTFPQVYVKGEFVGGLDVVKELFASGEFQTLVPAEKLVTLLADQGVTYDSFDILEDDDIHQGLKTHVDWPTFPMLCPFLLTMYYHRGQHHRVDDFTPTITPPQTSELCIYTLKNATLGEITSLVKQAIPNQIQDARAGSVLSFRHIFLDLNRGLFVGRDVGVINIEPPQQLLSEENLGECTLKHFRKRHLD